MNTAGLLVVAAVLVLGTVVGLWRRRNDGRFTSASASPGSASPVSSALSGVSPGGPTVHASHSAEASAAGPAGGAHYSAGPDAEGAGNTMADSSAVGQHIDPALLEKLGVEPAQATLLQFSSAFCAPCRAVRRISGEVADLLPGVRHVEVDAESHLDAVRALGIWRTPTLLVLDAEGRVTKRATGIPAKAQLIAVLGEFLPAARHGP